jgi:hypothetical protein
LILSKWLVPLISFLEINMLELGDSILTMYRITHASHLQSRPPRRR